MNTFLIVLIIIYFVINSLLTGYNYADDFEYRKGKNEKIWSIVWLVLCFLFGTVIYGIMLIYALISRFFRFLNEYFQLKFFFTFFFTKKWDNLEESKVKEINDFANKKDKSKLNNRIYIYCVNLLNKRLEKNKLKNK